MFETTDSLGLLAPARSGDTSVSVSPGQQMRVVGPAFEFSYLEGGRWTEGWASLQQVAHKVERLQAVVTLKHLVSVALRHRHEPSLRVFSTLIKHSM